jgi:hypothetical protein
MRSVALLTALLALALCAPASAELAIGSRSSQDDWIVTVSVKTRGLGPVDVSTGPVRPAVGWGAQWLEHDLLFTKMGDREVSFADMWRADVLGRPGRPMLIAVADWRCGYRAVRPIRAACLLPLDFVDVKSGRATTRTVTLWKGLRRAAPLEPGKYVFRQPIRYRFGKYPPADGEGRSGAIKIVYRIGAA